MEFTVEQAAEILIPILKNNKLVVFCGSGISVSPPSNLPVWDEFLSQFIGLYEEIETLNSTISTGREIVEDAKLQADRYPERVASVLKNRIKYIQAKSPQYDLQSAVIDFFTNLFAGKAPNENHDLIVKTNYPMILTSNYDKLLEQAASNNDFPELRFRSLSFNAADEIAAALYTKNPAIVHVHGDLEDVTFEDIVFTAEDYVNIRMKYPGFGMALRAIFATCSVLFVGYGGSDPHLEDVLEEMSSLLSWSDIQELPKYFITLKREKIGAIINEWKERLRTDIIALEEYSQMTELLRILHEAAPRQPKSQ